MNAILITLIMVAQVLFANYVLESLEEGVAMALGVLFASTSNVIGSNKHTFWGILLSTVLAVAMTLMFGGLTSHVLIVGLMGVFVFVISYLSVFGFRASLVSFSGLLAMVLSLSIDTNAISLLDYALYTGFGGIIYLIITYISRLLFPRIVALDKFVELFEKTAKFLEIRSDLIIDKANRDDLRKELFQLQAELSEAHQDIRDVVLSNRSKSGFSNRNRRRLLLLSELIDILDLAMANPVNYQRLDELDELSLPALKKFEELIQAMAKQLNFIARVIQNEEVYREDNRIEKLLEELDKEIVAYRDGIGLPESRQGTLLLLNFKHYQEKQAQKILGLERVLNNVTKKDSLVDPSEAHKFLTPQDYDPKKITNNLSLKSPIFRHSLRMAIVMMLGYISGLVLEMTNIYWILLTIVVIMRPNYGLTKERSKHRVVGTLIGALIATIVIYLTNNTTVYSIISVCALPFSFAFLQSNYRDAAAAITINVIFLFALFEPNILEVIQYRILDTVIGASLSFIAFRFLWPTWEYHGFDRFVSDAVGANQKFLNEIKSYYAEKGEVSTSYKISRREAFLNMGNLNAAYQRLNQEPKSKQKDLATSYELVVLSNTFLSSMTSLGTYIRTNTTTKPSEEFLKIVDETCKNLGHVQDVLKSKKTKSVGNSNSEQINEYFDDAFDRLAEERDQEILEGGIVETPIVKELKEIQLVSEQVKWLFNLSEKLIAMSNKYVVNRAKD